MFNWLTSFFSKKIATIKPSVINQDLDDLMRQGFSLHENGNDSAAAIVFKKILDINPFHADALYLLGLTVNRYGDYERGIELIKKAIASKNDEPFFHRALGDIKLSLLNFKEAAYSYENALKLDPDCIVTLVALGSAYEHLRRLKDAEDIFTRVLELNPTNHLAFTKRGEVFLDAGKVDLAIADFKSAHELMPTDASLYSSYLFSLNYSIKLSAKEIFIEHQKYDLLYSPKSSEKLNSRIKKPDSSKVLRIGYVSPDFRLHAVSCFFEPVLTQHDISQFEIFCYHLHQITDEVSLRLKSKCHTWVDCANLSDDALFKKIQEDNIDILVDLVGHTSYNRLLVFAQKPAPIQITWLGYLNTSGLSSMDYRIVDLHTDPLGASETFHSETLLRLPNSQWCYSKLESSVDVKDLPRLSSKYISFASFNRFSKLTEKALNLWAKVLTSIQNSKLLIMDVPTDEHERIKRLFSALNINIERIELYNRMTYEEFVKMHHQVDIAFDGYPYSGATSTCDSLWMGVPTITLVGETSISRSTSSIMKTLGLSDWIAYTEEEFVEIAKKHSKNVQNLAELRAGLRQKMQSSALMDAALFTKNLEKAYREVWVDKCNQAQST